MITYQDFLEVNEKDIPQFIQTAISAHKSSVEVRMAKTARRYYKKQNETIMKFQKFMYTISGKAIPDNWSANYKLRSKYFNRFVTQEIQYLLGNGATWQDEKTAEIVGKDFDDKLQELAKDAVISGVAFGFWNYDHLEVFDLPEFCPLWDEIDGTLKAGIRYWQIDDGKPVRATLYELDGYTDYIWNTRDKKDIQVLNEKRTYKELQLSTAFETENRDFENYSGFPIIPLWNLNKQSELEGMREDIDCYDLIKSGFANNVDEASYIYWAIQNAGGMDDIDLAKFVERMRTLHAAHLDDDGATATAHSIEAPFGSREALLTRLRNDLYEDAMALDTKAIQNGAVTATQIKAAYEPINSKDDDLEFNVLTFIEELSKIAGFEDAPTFTRSQIVNTTESITVIIQAAPYLSQEYVTKKILTLLGDGDQAEEVLNQLYADDMSRMGADE